jgi:hypothetical protein
MRMGWPMLYSRQGNDSMISRDIKLYQEWAKEEQRAIEFVDHGQSVGD